MTKGLNERIRAFLPATLWGTCILVLSLTPGTLIRELRLEDLFSLDKLGHLFFYAVFVCLLSFGFYRVSQGKLELRQIIISGAIALAMGAVLELFQAFAFVGRHFDVLDLIANIIGCAAGMIGTYILKKQRLWL